MSLYENELKELRVSDAHYVKLLASQRIQLSQLEKQKNAMAEENGQLAARCNGEKSLNVRDSISFSEATTMLEASKRLPRHHHQSEWDAMEIANLRAINCKLERELFAEQVSSFQIGPCRTSSDGKS